MYRVGVDLGGTNIVAGVINEEMKIMAEASSRQIAPARRKLFLRMLPRLSRLLL